MSYGYIIPYVKDPCNHVHVLVGKKHVISYTALSSFRAKVDKSRTEWSKINFSKPLSDDGNVVGTKIHKRFEGVLLPAGGKMCFFGGRAEKNENAEQAALRELAEETGLKISATTDKLKLVYTAADWGGKYYLLDLSNQTLDALRMHVTDYNSKARLYELENVDLSAIYNGGKIGNKFEIQELKWISVEELVNSMRHVDNEFIAEGCDRFTKLLCQHANVVPQGSAHVFNRAIQDYMLQQEVDGNVAAANVVVQRKKEL